MRLLPHQQFQPPTVPRPGARARPAGGGGAGRFRGCRENFRAVVEFWGLCRPLAVPAEGIRCPRSR